MSTVIRGISNVEAVPRFEIIWMRDHCYVPWLWDAWNVLALTSYEMKLSLSGVCSITRKSYQGVFSLSPHF